MKQATPKAIVSRHHPFYHGLAGNLQKYELKTGEGEREGKAISIRLPVFLS
jgi:hypothetical protein